MALYVPAGRRRRRAVLLAGAALVLGLALGLLAGRATAPSLAERVRSTQHEAGVVTAELRVLSLHQEASAASQSAGDTGTDFALRRARTNLSAALHAAPWITATTGQRLLESLDHLIQDAGGVGGAAFAHSVDAAAADIDAAFGLATAVRAGG